MNRPPGVEAGDLVGGGDISTQQRETRLGLCLGLSFFKHQCWPGRVGGGATFVSEIFLPISLVYMVYGPAPFSGEPTKRLSGLMRTTSHESR